MATARSRCGRTAPRDVWRPMLRPTRFRSGLILAAASIAAAWGLGAWAADGDSLRAEMPPLTAEPGDAARGRAIVTDRHKGLCLLCHSGPFPDQPHQGNLAPGLADVGTRLTEGQLRLRIADSRRLNAHTLMPSYHRTDGLARVAAAFQGRTIFTAQEVEDVVAFLVTLRGGAHDPSSKGQP